jgi:hypothetical protein
MPDGMLTSQIALLAPESFEIVLRSNVARDTLQSAALFNSAEKAVAEYVWNGIDAAVAGISPVITVNIDLKRQSISIADNGCGMSRTDLPRLWTMHGKTQKRDNGRRTRGKFGTGKVAALGVADEFVVDTRQNGLQNVHRMNIELLNAGSEHGNPVAPEVLANDRPTTEATGTIITIRRFHEKLTDETIRNVRRHLECEIANQPDVTVILNGARVEPEKVETDRTWTFDGYFGTLTVYHTVRSLRSDMQGTYIWSNNEWVGLAMDGLEGHTQSDRFFAHLHVEGDIEARAAEVSRISPFNQSRSKFMNKQNPFVRDMHVFIADGICRAIADVEREMRDRRQQAMDSYLRQQESELSRILSEDARELLSRDGIPGRNGGEIDPLKTTKVIVVKQEKEGEGEGDPENENETQETKPTAPRSRNRGLLARVELHPFGETESLHKMIEEERRILVNLDHPLIAGAKAKNFGITLSHALTDAVIHCYAGFLARETLKKSVLSTVEETIEAMQREFDIQSARLKSKFALRFLDSAPATDSI